MGGEVLRCRVLHQQRLVIQSPLVQPCGVLEAKKARLKLHWPQSIRHSAPTYGDQLHALLHSCSSIGKTHGSRSRISSSRTESLILISLRSC